MIVQLLLPQYIALTQLGNKLQVLLLSAIGRRLHLLHLLNTTADDHDQKVHQDFQKIERNREATHVGFVKVFLPDLKQIISSKRKNIEFN